jgi:23S rRNA (uracil1939-C5)-methyltransferase
MNIGEKHVVEITGYTHEGQGVARIGDLVVFTEKGLKNEKLEIEITEVKKNFARGKIIDIIEKSPFRVEPDYEKMGGCNLAHVSYEHQLEIKEEIITNALRMVPGIEEAQREKIISSDKPERYRNKGHFQIQRNKDGKISFGFFEEGSHNFVVSKESVLYSEKINKILGKIGTILSNEGKDITIYHRRTGQGNLKNIMIRENRKTDEIMLVFVTAESKKLSKKFIGKISDEIPEATSIYQNLNPGRNHEVLGKKNIHLKGKEYITDNISKFKFQIYPATFFQINKTQTEKLYKKAMEYLNPEKEETIVDAFGGIGTIGSFIAETAGKVISIDDYEGSEKEGKASAEINKINNIEFLTGKVEEVLPKLEVNPDAIVLDPPRGGSKKEVLDAIIEKKITRIVYISCNPGTLGRDLKILAEEGNYKVEKIIGIDMFSGTSHVECVVGIQRVESTK